MISTDIMSVNVSRNLNKTSGTMYTRIGLKNRAYNAFVSNYVRLAYVNGRLYLKESSESCYDSIKLTPNHGNSMFLTFYDGTTKVTKKIIDILKNCTGEHTLEFDCSTHSYYFNVEEKEAHNEEPTFADKVNELCGGRVMEAEDIKPVTKSVDSSIVTELQNLILSLMESERVDDAIVMTKALKIVKEEYR